MKQGLTYRPNKRKRAKSHGFLSRMSSTGGKRTLSRRRSKGRHKIVI